MHRVFLILLLLLVGIRAFSQDDELKIILPEGQSWNVKSEGEAFDFSIKTNRPADRIEMIAPRGEAMTIDSVGNFSWILPNDMVSEEDEELYYYVLFVASDSLDKDSSYVELTVKDKLEREVTPTPKEKNVVEESAEITEIILPTEAGWNLVKEGDTLQFTLRARTTTGLADGVSFSFEAGEGGGGTMDSLGHYSWVVPYDYVDRIQQTREKHIFFVAVDKAGNSVSKKVIISVFHRNQRPIIKTLPKFYVLMGTNNTYTISSDAAWDPDGDPIVFIVNPVDLPQGMAFNSQGKIQWEPSRSQFNLLKKESIRVPFEVEDQPSKDRSQGFLDIEASYMDMPPEITMVPSEEKFVLKENERLHLAFHLSDPNGDDNLSQFNFVSEDSRIEKDLLIKNTDTQYELVWTPGYDFVNDPDEKLEFTMSFFALDETNQTTEKKITIEVIDTEDLRKKDTENYQIYRNTLVETLNLLDQLEINQKSLEKELKQAKKGKRNRAITNAAIGAITGLSPVIAPAGNAQKTISVIGGTSTATLGTLEAKDILGKSINEINQKLKTNTELRNQFLSEGSSFARRYNSKKARRDLNFSYDLEKIRSVLNSPKIAILQLDANWENKKKLNNRRLKTTFPDFDSIDD